VGRRWIIRFGDGAAADLGRGSAGVNFRNVEIGVARGGRACVRQAAPLVASGFEGDRLDDWTMPASPPAQRPFGDRPIRPGRRKRGIRTFTQRRDLTGGSGHSRRRRSPGCIANPAGSSGRPAGSVMIPSAR